MSKFDRRDFLLKGGLFCAAPLLLGALPTVAFAETQGEWRWCTQCSGLFFNGFPRKGWCPASKTVQNGGHGHVAQAAGGTNLFLEYGDLPETKESQINWRFCEKCFQLFFDGFPTKGMCPVDFQYHRAQGYNYRMLHDVPASDSDQEGWRFCEKCMVMFWEQSGTKTRCINNSGGHKAQGYRFLLPTKRLISHKGKPAAGLPPEFRIGTELHTDGWAPIRGQTEITIKPDGTYTVTGRMYNSGAINIRFTLGVVLVSPKGPPIAFTVSNKRLDGTEVLIGRDRAYNWNHTANDPKLASHYRDLLKGKLGYRLVASSAVGSGLTNMLENMVWEMYRVLPDLGGATDVAIGKRLHFILNL